MVCGRNIRTGHESLYRPLLHLIRADNVSDKICFGFQTHVHTEGGRIVGSSFAYAQISGNVGRDPETKSTQSGKKIVSFSVAVEQGWGDNKTTGWYTVKVSGTGADFAEKLKKGSNVRVSGDLQIDSWDDKQSGQKRQSVVIWTNKVDYGESREAKSSSAPATRQAAAPPARQQAAPMVRPADHTSDPFEDDIPF